MAKSVTEWKEIIGNYYMSLPTVQTIYSLTESDITAGFSATFSKVNVENLLFYAFAFCVYTFELILDAFRVEIQAKVGAAFVANKSWWKAQSLAFQKGYNLWLDEKTFTYGYTLIDASHQIIKRVAVRESLAASGVCKVQLYVAGESNGAIAALTNADKALFEIYANQIKPAGVLIDVISGGGDVIDFKITVNYNPLLLTSEGLLITDNTTPVNAAIAAFINALNDTTFGGELNLTKMIDSVQATTGVVDAKITEFKKNSIVQNENWGTYESTYGWFSLGNLTITYQPQLEL